MPPLEELQLPLSMFDVRTLSPAASHGDLVELSTLLRAKADEVDSFLAERAAASNPLSCTSNRNNRSNTSSSTSSIAISSRIDAIDGFASNAVSRVFSDANLFATIIEYLSWHNIGNLNIANMRLFKSIL